MRPPIDPAEAAELLVWLKRHGFWAVHLGRNPAKPTVIVLYRKHDAWVDVVHVRGADRVEAARMPSGETADIWQPSKVTWLYVGHVIAALNALQHLTAHGGDPAAELREPAREGDPVPLWVTDAERATDKTYYPPAGQER